MKAKQKMIDVPLRLEGQVWRDMQELAQLCGHKVEVVISVLVCVGFLKMQRDVSEGLAARKAAKKKNR